MRNKNVGFLIVGVSFIILIIILLFNSGMKEIVSQSCDHGSSCSMYDTISFQTYLSLTISGIIFLIGLFLIFAKENEKVIIKHKTITRKEKKKPLDTSKLSKDEKQVIEILTRENGAVFQKSLMEELGVGKVKITRLMDRLEAKQLIERKRRGMNNIIVLKY
ncbi:MAG: hypothetical protein WC494_01835 [Candidatus Pacearchaeota archaeon]